MRTNPWKELKKMGTGRKKSGVEKLGGGRPTRISRKEKMTNAIYVHHNFRQIKTSESRSTFESLWREKVGPRNDLSES